MSSVSLYSIIMAGGKGTRFWPESTQAKPKQYLNLLGQKSLLEDTLERFDDLVPRDRRYVVTVKEQQLLAQSCSNGKIAQDGIVFEPSGRNTGPCILLTLAHLIKAGAKKSDIVAIVPSDHVILNKVGFKDTMLKAFHFALNKNIIVSIGITPHFPHTGFGYIEKGTLIDAEAFGVTLFKEKPHFELAKEYVSSGKYLWNAGMYVAPIELLLEEYKAHAPSMFQYFDELLKNIDDFDKTSKTYELIPSDSIDYSIMEKSKRIVVIPATFDWNDLGSWDALSSVIDETHGNTIVKSDGSCFLGSTDNIIYTPGKFVSLINIEKHIIVANDKVVLVAPISDAQEIKKIVEQLKKDRPDLL